MAEGFGQVPEGSLEKSFINSCIEKHKAIYEALSKFCAVTLEKLELHPSCPNRDFDVVSLSVEEFSEVRERVVEDLNKLDGRGELIDFVEDHGLLNSVEISFLLEPPKAEPTKPSRLKRLRSVLTRKKEEPKAPVEHAEGLSLRKRLRRIAMRWRNDIDKLEASIKKRISRSRPSQPRTNTSVSREEIARVDIHQMVADVHAAQFAIKAYKERIEIFEGKFEFLKIHESCKEVFSMNEACSESLRKEMEVLVTYALSVDTLVYEMDKKNQEKAMFRDLHDQYERRLIAKEMEKCSKPEKTSKKGKRKSVKEDEEKLLDSNSPSPKRSKDEEDEDEKEVRRGLRRTSVSDNDDDMD